MSWFLPYIDMNQPWIYMCSPSWTPSHLPPHPIPLGLPVHQPWAPVSCIQPGLMICFTLDNIHVSMLSLRSQFFCIYCSTWVSELGRREGGSGWGTHWLIHVNVWQKPRQYWKVISLQQIKINGKKISWSSSITYLRGLYRILTRRMIFVIFSEILYFRHICFQVTFFVAITNRNFLPIIFLAGYFWGIGLIPFTH